MGWAINDLGRPREGVKDLLETMIEHIPSPKVNVDDDFKMLITQTESNPYFGRQLIGKIDSGSVQLLDKMCTVNQDGETHENSKISRIIKKWGVNQIELKEAFAGDIISMGGFHSSTVGNIVNEPGKNHVIESIPIDPPMLSLTLTVNDSPLKGIDGDKLTISQIRDRVITESEDDVSLKI